MRNRIRSFRKASDQGDGNGCLVAPVEGLPLIIFAGPIIRVWIGAQFQQEGGVLLAILVIANVVRLAGVPYVTILVGTGQQRLVIVSPVLEGVSNLVASIFLGMRYGALGSLWER